MARTPIEAWCFSLVVVRLGRRFLVVQEKDGSWYLPAGRVEPGESFSDAAVREAREETGLDIVLEGILRVEHSPTPRRSRFRVVFVARPADDTLPKSVPDGETRRAAWLTLDEIRTLPVRGYELIPLFEAVLAGASVHPLGLLVPEAAPY